MEGMCRSCAQDWHRPDKEGPTIIVRSKAFVQSRAQQCNVYTFKLQAALHAIRNSSKTSCFSEPKYTTVILGRLNEASYYEILCVVFFC